MPRQPFNPWLDRTDQVEQALDLVEQGRTLAQVAAAIGVHASTLFRWLAADRLFRMAMDDAGEAARKRRLRVRPVVRLGQRQRPPVEIHPDCPDCQSPIEVRTGGGRRFWRCSTYPKCSFACWRPRHPGDCQRCGGPRFWTHTRSHAYCRVCRFEDLVGRRR